MQLSPTQLTRASESELLAYGDITIARLRQIESDNDIPDLRESEIEEYLESQQQALERELQAISEQLIQRQINLDEYERLAAELVSAAMLVALLAAFGGTENLRRSPYGREYIRQVSRAIRGEVRAIIATGNKIESGDLTIAQFLATRSRRAMAFVSTFRTAQIFKNIAENNHNEGIRRLTSVEPCPDCPGYQQLSWVPIEDIVPVATYCVCKGNCKCEVITRFNPDRALAQLTGGTITQRVTRYGQALQDVEDAFLRRHNFI